MKYTKSTLGTSAVLVCEGCGCLVALTSVHDAFHAMLARDYAELAAELIEQMRNEE